MNNFLKVAFCGIFKCRYLTQKGGGAGGEGGAGLGGAWAHIPEQRLEIEPVVWVPRNFEDTYLWIPFYIPTYLF